MKLTERQEQALRGLRLAELKLEEQAAERGQQPAFRLGWRSAGSVALYVQDELPDRPQHGNGACDGRSWSGRVPYARYMGPALKALVKKGLARERHWRERELDARSSDYRITDAGRELADELLAARA